MLLNMRDKMEGWIKWIIVSVLILVFALWGVSYYLESNAVSAQSVATVNGKNISRAAFQNSYQRIENQILSRGGKINSPVIQKAAIDQLINHQILLQNAHQLGLRIPKSLINQIIVNLTPFQIKGKFSVDKFVSVLNQHGMTAAEYKNNLKQDLLNRQLQFGLFGSEIILPNTIQNLEKLLDQTRSAKIYTIDYHQFKSKVHISNGQIRDFYTKYSKLFSLPEQVQIKYIKLNLSDYKKSINKPSLPQLKQYYLEHKNRYKTAELRQIKIKGNNFNQTQWIKLNFENKLSELVFRLKKVGESTSKVRYKNHWVTATWLNTQKSKLKSFKSIQKQLQSDYITSQARDLYQSAVSQLQNLANSNASSLQPIAKVLKLKIQTSEFFTQNQSQSQSQSQSQLISHYSQIRQAAFSPFVLKDKMNSQVIHLSQSKAVVLRIFKTIPAHIQPLKTVYSQIKSQLENKILQSTAVKYAQKLVLNPSKLKLLNLKFNFIKNISRTDKNISNIIKSAVFNTYIPNQSHPIVYSWMNNPAQKKVYIIGVTDIKSKFKSKNLKNKNKNKIKDLTKFYRLTTAAQMGQEYLKLLHQKAKIIIHTKNLK